MVTLKQAKNFLRVDDDIVEDDELIGDLVIAAGDYIKNQTGKMNADNLLYDQCVKLLVAHWYEQRTIFASRSGSLSQLPHSVTAIIQHLANCNTYEAAND